MLSHPLINGEIFLLVLDRKTASLLVPCLSAQFYPPQKTWYAHFPFLLAKQCYGLVMFVYVMGELFPFLDIET